MKPRYLVIGIIVALIGAIALSYPYFLEGAASWLMVQHKLEKADAILVVSGDNNGERTQEGVNLYKQGWAKYLILSGGPLVWKMTYAENMKRQAVSLGMPEKAVILEDRSKSTMENAELCLPIIKKRGFKSIILISSPYHMRRSLRTFREVFDKEGVKIMAYPVQKSSFNPHGWWLRHEDTQLVVWEYVAMVLYRLKEY